MCITREVYCWHCQKQFSKQDYNGPEGDDFEPCPHCGKGYDDLSEDAKQAVDMTLKAIQEQEIWL